MRIVAGKFAGRNLTSPQGSRVRPTAEHVRVGMLDMIGDAVNGARVIDLFAGTGALGLEAISRGAAFADFVEFRPDSLHSLRANIAALRLLENTRVFKRDALPFAEAIEPGRYDVAFADPPYGSRMLDRLVGIWERRRFSGILVVEHDRAHDLPAGLDRQEFATTVITIYRARRP